MTDHLEYVGSLLGSIPSGAWSDFLYIFHNNRRGLAQSIVLQAPRTYLDIVLLVAEMIDDQEQYDPDDGCSWDVPSPSHVKEIEFGNGHALFVVGCDGSTQWSLRVTRGSIKALKDAVSGSSDRDEKTKALIKASFDVARGLTLIDGIEV